VVEERVCPSCEAALIAGRCAACERRRQAAAVHRELVVLMLLVAAAVAGFFTTRAAAAANRDRRLRDAAAWFSMADHDLAAGRVTAGTGELRRAAALDPGNPRYRLALARALTAADQDDAARRVLVGLRELAPEEGEFNLELARIDVRRADSTEAIRDYRNALYGVWTRDDPETRRHIRFEFIDYLLSIHERSRALSELVVLAPNLPEEPQSQVRIGRLFLAAGDPARALQHLDEALRAAPRDQVALTAAAQAAFAIGDYARAERYARAAPGNAETSRLRSTVRLVLANDPLLPRLMLAERGRRLKVDLGHALARLDGCGGTTPEADPLRTLREEAHAFARRLNKRSLRDAAEAADDGVALVLRIENATVSCAPVEELDRALVLIGRRHASDPS
jgi:tetratricopeptide (TPR) repeat protein